jgi:hypothetical protein
LVQNPADRIRFRSSGVWSVGNLITTCPASASSRITISPILSSVVGVDGERVVEGGEGPGDAVFENHLAPVS